MENRLLHKIPTVRAVKSAVEERESRLRALVKKKRIFSNVHRPFSKRAKVKLLGKLYVVVHEAQGTDDDERDKFIYMCNITFSGQSKKTKAYNQPKWNDNFVFDVFNEETNVFIDVIAQPHRPNSSTDPFYTAGVNIPLHNFFTGITHDEVFPLSSEPSSRCPLTQIHVSIQYKREKVEKEIDLEIDKRYSLPILDEDERQLLERIACGETTPLSARSEGDRRGENDDDLSSMVVNSDITEYRPQIDGIEEDPTEDDEQLSEADNLIDEDIHTANSFASATDRAQEQTQSTTKQKTDDLKIDTPGVDSSEDEMDMNSLRQFIKPTHLRDQIPVDSGLHVSLDLQTIEELRQCLSSVRDLETRITEMENRFEDMEAKIGDLEAHVVKLNSNNDNTTNQLTDCKEDCHSNISKIAKLEERLESLEQKQQSRVIFFILQFSIGLLSTIVKIFGMGVGWAKSFRSSSSPASDSSLSRRFDRIQQSFQEQSEFLNRLSAQIGASNQPNSHSGSDEDCLSYDSFDDIGSFYGEDLSSSGSIETVHEDRRSSDDVTTFHDLDEDEQDDQTTNRSQSSVVTEGTSTSQLASRRFSTPPNLESTSYERSLLDDADEIGQISNLLGNNRRSMAL